MCNQLKFLRKCADGCEMDIELAVSDTHYGCLRCREHGFVKWLSYAQYKELEQVMSPSPGRRVDPVR